MIGDQAHIILWRATYVFGVMEENTTIPHEILGADFGQEDVRDRTELDMESLETRFMKENRMKGLQL